MSLPRGLNPSQQAAVATLSGPLLVLAGAGTGKTRVITYRMAELIRSGVAAERILSVTFTNKAAREMQERTARILGKRLKSKPLISTFHSFCVGVLRREIAALGYPPNFVIYDRGDQDAAARRSLRDIRVQEVALRPGDLLAQISRWKMAGIRPPGALQLAADDRELLAATAYRRYQRTLRSSGAVDFDDLLLLTGQLFEEFPQVLERHQGRFDHVQIDEYQDTNEMQFELVEALVRPHRNLCVVGDDDQSIYGWRGADVKHILSFQQHFPGATVVRLEDNYRCTGQILDLANCLVQHNLGRHDKQLVAHKPDACDVRFLEFPDELAEAENIVREIKYLHEVQQVPLAHFAILFRTNEQPRVFETELRRAQLRYLLVGGQSFFDRREVRDLLAYLKVLTTPSDEMSLLRIINVPSRGIGEGTVAKLLARAVRQKRSLWDVAPDAAAEGEIATKALAALQRFQQQLDDFGRRFREQPRALASLFQELVDAIDYESEIQKQYKDAGQQLARSVVLHELADALSDYVARAPEPSLADFLEQTALAGRDEPFERDDDPVEDALSLMTLHSAKGLEFPRVYLVGMEENLLPHQRSLELGGAAIEEERRLCYVGITRAMDHLTLTRAATRTKWGKRVPSKASRFLAEMRGDQEDLAAGL